MKQLILIILISPVVSLAQRSAKNVYVELGGITIAAIYDTRISNSNKGLGARAGLGLVIDRHSARYVLPVGLNYLAGSRKNFLELGAGVMYVYFREASRDSWFNFTKENFLLPYGWIGYKYQPLQKGFTFRAGLCQYWQDLNLEPILGITNLYPSLSLGYSFQ